MTAGSINGNTSPSDAGGILAYDGVNVTLAGGEIKGNKAAYGAGVEILAADVTLNGTAIEDNISTSTGGGVYIQGNDMRSAKFTMISGSVSNNTAYDQGSGIFAVINGGTTEVDIQGGKISGNTVDGDEIAITLLDWYGDDPDENTEFAKLYMSGSPDISGTVMLNDRSDYGPKIEVNGEFTPANKIKIQDTYGREGRAVVTYKDGLTPNLDNFESAFAPSKILKQNGQDIVWQNLIRVEFNQLDNMPPTKWVETNVYVLPGETVAASDIPTAQTYAGYHSLGWFARVNGQYVAWNSEAPITAKTTLYERWAFDKADVTVTADKAQGCENNPIVLTAQATHGLDSARLTYQWYKDGTAIDGATESTYTVTESGSYYVAVTATDEATNQSSEVNSDAKDYVIAHDWSADYIIDAAATCTEKGEESIHCSICGTTKDSREIPATGHHSEKWIASDKVHYQKCDVCGEKFNEGEHTMGEWKVIKNATSTETGLKEKACTTCNYKVSETIAKTADNTSANTAVKTGQESNMMLYVVIIAAAAVCVVLVLLRIRKKNSK